MPVPFRALLLIVTASVLCFANVPIVITDTDPYFGNSSYQASCTIGQVGCVVGAPLAYDFQDFSLVGPSGGGTVGTWTLTIDTNYGTELPGPGAHPANPVIPGFCSSTSGPTSTPDDYPNCLSGDGSAPLTMSDFLIKQGSNYFAVVLSPHTSVVPGGAATYTPGDLYSGTGFENSTIFNAGNPVMLDPGGSLAGSVTGSGLTAVANTDGAGHPCFGQPHNFGGGGSNDCAEFKITDTFTVSSGSPFASFDPTQSYTIYASSADCDNGGLVYQHTVPEPGGLVWMAPALLLLGGYLRRRSLAAVK